MINKKVASVTGFQSVSSEYKSGLVKPAVTFCLTVVLSVGIFGGSAAMADQAGNKHKGERLGGFTLEDGSMLGRYGDVNDEWVAPTKVQVSRSEMTEKSKRKMPKKDNRLGSYSLQDDAMLGHYGDKNDE